MGLVRGTIVGARYQAQALIARGGMGEVWKCTDLESKSIVAVKVMKDVGADPRQVRLFRDEVHATARLDHPAIVRVYDLVESEGGLALVMEFCPGEPLSSPREMSFGMLRSVLSQVLQALAYAHSRGVLHLDVKPGNVMVETRGTDARAWLVDFGIARAWRSRREGAGTEVEMLSGTVGYMAPEQLMSRKHRFGPWTDLFAFGATVYRLLVGRPPFATSKPTERLFGAPPTLDTQALGLPEGLSPLLVSLLAPREADRPTHAADVLHALRKLDGADDALLTIATKFTPQSAPTITDAGKTAVTLTDTAAARAQAILLDAPSMHTLTDTVPIEDVPESLRVLQFDPPPGAFALFGLREMPVVGRDAERDIIWQTLRTVRAERCPRVLLIGGEPGMGKSRTALEAIERAHEHGLAHTAWTTWSQGGSGNEGLRGLAENILDTTGVSDADLTAHLTRWTERFPGEDDARFRALATQLVRPDAVSTTDADLALRVTSEAIERLAIRRAAVIWLDNAQWSDGAAASLCELLRGRCVGVAVLVTCRHVEGPPLVQADLNVDLPRLDTADCRTLLHGLLSMDASLLDLLAPRMDGNPLMATLFIEELIAERALVRHEGRHALKEPLDGGSIPEGLTALWERRITRSGADREALSMLAVVRERIGEPELLRLVELQGEVILETLGVAERAGILRRDGSQRHFVHGLREHVIAGIDPARRPMLHAIAADVLAVHLGREDVQEERARHLHAAGEWEQACLAMRDAIGWSVRRMDNTQRERRCQQLINWATQAGLGRHHAHALAEQAHLFATRGDKPQAATLMEQAVAIEDAHGIAQPWVALRRSQVERLAARSEAADALCEQALDLARREGDGEVETHALGQLGLAAQRRGDSARARELFQRSAERARQRGDAGSYARALLHVANLAPLESSALFEEAIDNAVRAGVLLVELTARQVFADALFLQGNRDRARDEMAVVVAQARARRIRPLVSIVEIQLATWSLREENPAMARQHANGAREAGADRGNRVERCMLAAIEASAAAMDGDEGLAITCLDRLATERGDYDEEDLRRVLEMGLAHASEVSASRFQAALGRAGTDT